MFSSNKLLSRYIDKVIESNFKFSNEFYTSCAIKMMLTDNVSFSPIYVEPTDFTSLGTPEQVQQYLLSSHAFLFDLDGTLVDSSEIYTNVWSTLLKPFRANVDQTFFKNYIDGNNDEMALRRLLPTIDSDTISSLSVQKDQLFLHHMDKLKVIPGADTFLQKVWMEIHS